MFCMSTQPPLNWLRSFVVAARALSFTRAAHELSITQAAVSKHVKGLESWLGVQLFVREAHGLALTELGQRYFHQCHPLLQQLESFTQTLATRSDRARLRLRCNISYSVVALPAKLTALRQRFPALEVDINNGIFEPDRPSENAHLQIGYAPRAALVADGSCKILSDDRIFPVVASGRGDDALADLPLLEVHGYSGEWDYWLRRTQDSSAEGPAAAWLGQVRRRAPGRLRSDNSLTVYQLAAAGLGVALARSSLVAPLIAARQLVPLAGAPALLSPDSFYARLSPQGHHHQAALALFESL